MGGNRQRAGRLLDLLKKMESPILFWVEFRKVARFQNFPSAYVVQE